MQHSVKRHKRQSPLSEALCPARAAGNVRAAVNERGDCKASHAFEQPRSFSPSGSTPFDRYGSVWGLTDSRLLQGTHSSQLGLKGVQRETACGAGERQQGKPVSCPLRRTALHRIPTGLDPLEYEPRREMSGLTARDFSSSDTSFPWG
jgi:hypothetical protein